MSVAYISFDEGSARKVATAPSTQGGSTVERWREVIDEAFLSTYTICTAAISTATANSHLLQIMAGASNDVLVRSIEVFQMVAAGAATQDQLELRRLTTAGTGGTAITAQLLDPADSAAGATGMSLASSKGTEGVLLDIAGGVMLATVAVAGRELVYRWPRNPFIREKPIRIAAGTSNGVCLKNVTAIASGTIFVVATVSEITHTL